LADVFAFEVGEGEITISEIDENKSTASKVDCDTDTTRANKGKFTIFEISKGGTIETGIDK
ncbi:10851_t:CDS:1, partial [Funneliformis caledonium]